MPAPSKSFRLEKNAARLKRYRLSLRRKPGSQSERAAAGTTRRRKTYRAYTRARISAPPSSPCTAPSSCFPRPTSTLPSSRIRPFWKRKPNAKTLGKGNVLKKGEPTFPLPKPASAQPTPSSPKTFFNGAHGDHVSAAAFTLAAVFRRRLLSFNARRLLLQKVFSLAGASCLSLRTHYPDRRIP